MISTPATEPVEHRRRFSAAGSIVLGVAGVLLSLGAAVAVEAQPRTPDRLAAVFPPWWSTARVFDAAGEAGNIAGAGGASFVVILRGDPARLAVRAREAGALLLLDPAMAGVCARPISSEAKP